MRSVALAQDTSPLTSPNNVVFAYGSMEEAFPKVDPGIVPLGVNVLCQIRHPKRRTKGGIILDTESRKTEHYNTQVAKVIGIGDLAFKFIDEQTGELRDWVGGRWYEVGNFVRLPRYGGDRFTVPYDFSEKENGETLTVRDEVVFAIFKAKDVHGRIVGDPLAIKAYLD